MGLPDRDVLQPRVAVVVRHGGDRGATERCLKSLAKGFYPSVETILVAADRAGSPPPGWAAVFTRLTILPAPPGAGWAQGCNLGIAEALGREADFVLILNADTVLDPRALGALVEATGACPTIGVAGPKVCYLDRPDMIRSAGGRIRWWRAARDRGRDEPDRGQYDEMGYVDYVPANAMLVKAEVFRAGTLLPEDTPPEFTGAEFCRRAGRSGWRCFYVPDALAWQDRLSS